MSCLLWIKLVFFFSSILDDYNFFFLPFCMGLNFQFIIAKKYESRQLCLVLTLWEMHFIFYCWIWCSVGKESTCNAGDLGSVPGLGRSAREGLPTLVFSRLPCGSAGKGSACSAGDLGLIPGLGRSPGEGKGYPVQYSGLENYMDCRVHRVTKSQTRLSNFHFQFMMLAVGFSWKPSISLKKVLSFLNLLSFYVNVFLILSYVFYASIPVVLKWGWFCP